MFCKICEEELQFVLEERWVCLKCDELTFDIVIESEDIETPEEKKKAA